MLERRPAKSPTKGPQVTVRLRNRKELEMVRRAAKALNISINTLFNDAGVRSAEAILEKVRSEREAVQKTA